MRILTLIIALSFQPFGFSQMSDGFINLERVFMHSSYIKLTNQQDSLMEKMNTYVDSLFKDWSKTLDKSPCFPELDLEKDTLRQLQRENNFENLEVQLEKTIAAFDREINLISDKIDLLLACDLYIFQYKYGFENIHFEFGQSSDQQQTDVTNYFISYLNDKNSFSQAK
ncbi:MAG: hypothetical protein GQ574_02185 [Crocinitomix sp.]|nr:hypothetical protein [Crocinitomix sp.]